MQLWVPETFPLVFKLWSRYFAPNKSILKRFLKASVHLGRDMQVLLESVLCSCSNVIVCALRSNMRLMYTFAWGTAGCSLLPLPGQDPHQISSEGPFGKTMWIASLRAGTGLLNARHHFHAGWYINTVKQLCLINIETGSINRWTDRHNRS